MKSAYLLIAVAACTEMRDPIKGTQSLEVTLAQPSDPGSPSNRLPDTVRTVAINVKAFGPDGQPDATYNNDVQVYLNYLGTLTPYLGDAPLAKFHVTNGVAMNQTVTLPAVFGPATVWVDDGTDMTPTYATGASPTLWFRDPFIADIQRPSSETAVDAFTNSPLDGKNVAVEQSRYGAQGRLVVSSVFSQGYTLADMKCADAAGHPPCVAGDYDFVEVFSFSAPLDQNGVPLVEGQVVQGFAGGISDFNGLTEVGFPQTFTSGAPDINPAREPTPAKVDASWFTTNKIMFERNEAGPIEVDNGAVCNVANDPDYTKYFQWKIDPSGVGGDCSTNKNVINIITQGTVNIDPATLVGKTLPKVVGILRPVNIGTFNVWIIYPRSAADLQLQ